VDEALSTVSATTVLVVHCSEVEMEDVAGFRRKRSFTENSDGCRSFASCSQAPAWERGKKPGRPLSALFPSSRLGTRLCRSSSFGEAVPKPELGNEGKRGERPLGDPGEFRRKTPRFSCSRREAGASRAGCSQAGAWERGEKCFAARRSWSFPGRAFPSWSLGTRGEMLCSEAKLELPGQGVPKLELGNEGKERLMPCRSRLAGDPDRGEGAAPTDGLQRGEGAAPTVGHL
jgi:hypothetical protein